MKGSITEKAFQFFERSHQIQKLDGERILSKRYLFFLFVPKSNKADDDVKAVILIWNPKIFSALFRCYATFVGISGAGDMWFSHFQRRRDQSVRGIPSDDVSVFFFSSFRFIGRGPYDEKIILYALKWRFWRDIVVSVEIDKRKFIYQFEVKTYQILKCGDWIILSKMTAETWDE